VLAFVAGGCGAWLAVQWVLPQAQELWAVFLCGGLFGLLLYRLWTMLLTSLLGTLLAGHAGLLLLEQLFSFDAVGWVTQNVPALNGVVVALVVLGVMLQSASAPDEAPSGGTAIKGDKKDKKEKKEQKKDEPAGAHGHEAAPQPAPKPTPPPWWKKVLTARKAA
jgi:hypothetical protein